MTANKPTSRGSSRSDLARVDAHKVSSEEYEELPKLADEMLARASVHQVGGHAEPSAGMSTIDGSSCRAVERDPERCSGAWVFRGTRVPVSALFDNLDGGIQVDEFVELFPGVTQRQVDEVLEQVARGGTAPRL